MSRRKQSTGLWKRKIENRTVRKILILTEGEKTEPNYFRSFPDDNGLFEIEGIGFVGKSLVEEAVRRKNHDEDKGRSYNQVWCVLDMDNHTEQELYEAVLLGRKYNISLAYSVEAFEIWYILHFEYLQSGIPRAQYHKKLSEHLGHPYVKNSLTMYQELLDKQETAKKNAERLLASFPRFNNPSTTVHDLVSIMNKYI